MAKREKLVVLINGLAGTGKSVLCERIAKHFKIKYYPTSGILRSIMEKELKKQKVPIKKNTGFWESTEAKKFMQERLNDSKFDKKVEEKLFKLVKKGGVVLDSWTMPWLSKKGYKIWLTASDEIRFNRVAGRDEKSIEETKKNVLEKEKKTIEIYKKAYGFAWGKNLKIFNLIINTDKLNKQEVFEKALKGINIFLKTTK